MKRSLRTANKNLFFFCFLFSLVSWIEKYNICIDIIFRQFLYNLVTESWGFLWIPVFFFWIPGFSADLERIFDTLHCCHYVIKELVRAFSCAYVQLWMFSQEARVTLGCYASLVLSKLSACIHNLMYACLAWTIS